MNAVTALRLDTYSEQAHWFIEILGYCHDVTTGIRPAAKTEIAGCQKFLNDYESSQANKDFQYYFDFHKAWKIIAFAENLPHVKGKFAAQLGAKKRIRLEPWQKFIFANIFGWVRKDTGLRRFTVVYLRIPRKNGKSIMGAIIGLYMLCADGEAGAEVYCGAGSLDQANKVFEPAKKMVELTPSLKKAYRLIEKARSISRLDGSVFKPIIGKPGDGDNPSCAIVDEFHEHATSDLYDTMATGMGAREQPLMVVITTSGEDLFSPCYDMDKDAVSVLLGVIEWAELFAMCYGIDDDDDWTDPVALIKANPNYGISVNPEVVLAAQQRAIQSAGKQNPFKTKHLNVWCNAKNGYYNVLSWQKCHDPNLDLNDFATQQFWIGVDLAKKRDLSAKIRLFKKTINGQTHYYIFSKFYICESQITEQENPVLHAMFTKWQAEGWIDVCDGNEQDFNVIRDDILEDSHNFDLQEVAYDPWGGSLISTDLQQADIQVVMIPQHGSFLTMPINELEAAIDSGRIHHDGNPVMDWCISNVIVHEYKSERKMPDKQTNDSKIDGASALFNVLCRTMTPGEIEEAAEIIFL